MDKIFTELGIEIVLATIFGIIAKVLRQPLVIAYIFAGFVLGPALFGISPNHELTSLFSTVGIAFLLFIVGLELSTAKIKEAGRKVLAIGFIQILFTAILGYILCIALGFSSLSSIYIGGLLSFSSTVIVVNLLTEKKAISTLYGKITLGILILQDIFALLVLVLLSGVGAGNNLELFPFLLILLKGFFAFTGVYLFSHFIVSRIFRYLAHSLDILFLASIAWCFAIAGFFSYLGFSIEMGAFIAGISLANIPYAEEMSLKLFSLRDFFLILFFITLGVQINWSGIGGMIFPLIILVLFVVFVKSLIVMISSSRLGFSKRTSFYTSVSLSQVSEFSLIIAAIGLSLGHIDKNISSLIIMVSVITILTSSYLITFLGNIYNFLRKPLSVFNLNDIDEKNKANLNNHIIIFGYHRLARHIYKSLERITKKIIIVDIDPDVIDTVSCEGKYCIYGDAYDPELLGRLNIEGAKIVLSTFPGKKSNRFLIKKIRAVNKKIKIIIVAEHSDDALYLYNAGADYVILPHHLSGEKVASMFDSIRKKQDSFAKIKKAHIKALKSYKDSF